MQSDLKYDGLAYYLSDYLWQENNLDYDFLIVFFYFNLQKKSMDEIT